MNTSKKIPHIAHNKLFNIVHIVSRGKKWAIIKTGSKRATSLHQFREQAYFEARQISYYVVVHNKDGSILFSHNLENINNIIYTLIIITTGIFIYNHEIKKKLKAT